MQYMVETKNLRKVYRTGDEKVVALDNIDLTIEQGQVCCILGTSGSGKSTLLNQLAGLEKPTRGTVKIKGELISKMSEKQLAVFRQKHIGFVFQSYNLIQGMTAVENVAMPLMFRRVSRKKREEAAREMLKQVGLGERMDHRPNEMSGGQQRAVALAHADNGTLLLIGDVELDTQLRIVLGIGLGNDRFDERAVQLAAQQLGNDVRDLRELHDIGVRRVLLGEVGLNGAELRADLVLRLVGVGQRGEGIRLVLHGHERLAADIVDIREVHLVLTGGIGRVTGERKVDLLRAELAERTVEVHA